MISVQTLRMFPARSTGFYFYAKKFEYGEPSQLSTLLEIALLFYLGTTD